MPDDLHEWVSFEDPDEERTWIFDLSFLTSPWTCIYGNGCQGVLTGPADDLAQGRITGYQVVTVDEDPARGPMSGPYRIDVHPASAGQDRVVDGASDGVPVTIAYWVDAPVAGSRVNNTPVPDWASRLPKTMACNRIAMPPRSSPRCAR